MELQKKYSTVVLSDIHLGSEHSHTEAVTRFLKQIRCKKLILNGDIIDGWQLKKSRKRWKPEHTRFFKTLMLLMERDGTEIIYVRGNHDDFLDALVPFTFSNITIVKDYVLHTHGKNYYVTHGDIFDSITTHMRWLAMMGDWGYTFLLWFNKQYNHWRAKKGKSYFSMSQYVKHKVKGAVSYICDFERELVRLAESRKYNGVICGHIHQAANTYYGDIHYLNSGDWVESLTALVEDETGRWNIISCAPVEMHTSEEAIHLYPAVV